MYRKQDGRRGFSFTKFADAIVPNLWNDTTPMMLNTVHPHHRDMLYSHQLVSIDIRALNERSCQVAGVVDSERASKNVLKALRKHEIVSSEGYVNTTKIGPRFIHQVAMLNAVRQRELVNMLFWWEEESQRLVKLLDEFEELSSMVAQAELHAAEAMEDMSRKEQLDQLKFARERVKMKIRQRPSQRREDIEANTDDIMDHFRGRSNSSPVILGNSVSLDTTLPAPRGIGTRHLSVADQTELPSYTER